MRIVCSVQQSNTKSTSNKRLMFFFSPTVFLASTACLDKGCEDGKHVNRYLLTTGKINTTWWMDSFFSFYSWKQVKTNSFAGHPFHWEIHDWYHIASIWKSNCLLLLLMGLIKLYNFSYQDCGDHYSAFYSGFIVLIHW